MSDLGWRAERIARAKAAGGVELETYRRPGFTGAVAGRRSEASASAEGFEVWTDPDPEEDDEEE